jgi:hypothetical protein
MLCLLSDGIIKLRPEKNAGFSEKKPAKTAKGSKNRCFPPPEQIPKLANLNRQGMISSTIQKQIPAIKFKQLQFP